MGSHEKGQVAEREVAALLKQWWRQIEPEALFVRTPLSGGWHDDEHRTEFNASGDIMSTAKLWPFDVEVKRREGWVEGEFIAGRQSPVWQWWRQSQISARPSGHEPMLWIRRNRRPWVVLLRETYVESLFKGRAVDMSPSTLCIQCTKPLKNGCTCKVPRPGSGCLGSPLYRWGAELNAIQYGPAIPVAFSADDLLAVHPSRFIKGGLQAPGVAPEHCPVCGTPNKGVRGSPSSRRCGARCGWEFTVDTSRTGW